MKKVRKMVVVLLMVFGAVSVSFAYDLSEYDLERVQYVKNKVEYLEELEKNKALNLDGERALKEGRLYLEFAEKLKQSKQKECMYAVRDVIGDDDNKERYRYGRYGYRWSDTSSGEYFRCLSIMDFNENLKKQEEFLDRQRGLRDAIIRQKANLMKSGDGALLKDGVTEVGTLSDGTKIEIEKK